MAFKDFTYRVRVVDSRPCRDWAERNIKMGHWGMMRNIDSIYVVIATYCFEFEEDAVAFKLVHGGLVCK